MFEEGSRNLLWTNYFEVRIYTENMFDVWIGYREKFLKKKISWKLYTPEMLAWEFGWKKLSNKNVRKESSGAKVLTKEN